MVFGGTIAKLIANPEQLAVMQEALEAHCLAYNIVNEYDREHIAHLIVLMSKGGAQTVEEFRAGLVRLHAANRARPAEAPSGPVPTSSPPG